MALHNNTWNTTMLEHLKAQSSRNPKVEYDIVFDPETGDGSCTCLGFIHWSRNHPNSNERPVCRHLIALRYERGFGASESKTAPAARRQDRRSPSASQPPKTGNAADVHKNARGVIVHHINRWNSCAVERQSGDHSWTSNANVVSCRECLENQ